MCGAIRHLADRSSIMAEVTLQIYIYVASRKVPPSVFSDHYTSSASHRGRGEKICNRDLRKGLRLGRKKLWRPRLTEHCFRRLGIWQVAGIFHEKKGKRRVGFSRETNGAGVKLPGKAQPSAVIFLLRVLLLHSAVKGNRGWNRNGRRVAAQKNSPPK